MESSRKAVLLSMVLIAVLILWGIKEGALACKGRACREGSGYEDHGREDAPGSVRAG